MDDPGVEELEQVQSICASLPDTEEQQAWTGVRWRVRGRTFAHLLVVSDGKPQSHARAVGTDGPVTVVTFRAPAAELDAYASMGEPFFHAGWGRHVVGLVINADTDWDEVRELLTDSYRLLAPRMLAARLDASGACR